MTSGPLLVANLGAEEAEEGAEAAVQRKPPPRVRAAARLWRWLFGESAIVSGAAAADDPEAWPHALAESRERAAFDWLTPANVCVPWLGTEAAEGIATAAGLMLWGPAPAVVSRVHDKAFALRAADDLGLVPRSLRGTTHLFEADDLSDLGTPERLVEALRARIADWPEWTQGRFTLKPRYGTSGRGRVDGDTRTLVDPSRFETALPRLASRGGAVLEPWLARTSDLSVQFRIDPEGQLTLLGSLELLTGRSGSYRGHRGQIDSRGRVFSGHAVDESLRGAAAQIAHAASNAGFFGAAGLDALCFRHPEAENGDATLRPVVELNARFTMGTVVLGVVRRLLPRVRQELELSPGERRAFHFELDAPKEGWQVVLREAGQGALLVPLGLDGDLVQPAIVFSRADERDGEPT